jgi:MraZ protein
VLFTGEYEHTIDAKLRVAVPSDIRAVLDPAVHGEGFYAAPGQNGALWIWPSRKFEELVNAMDASLLPDDEVMAFDDFFFSQAARLEVDSAGRVRLPERLLRGAGIEKTVTILGVRDHLELRDPAEWATLLEEKRRSQAELMQKARAAMNRRRGSTNGIAQDGTDVASA